MAVRHCLSSHRIGITLILAVMAFGFLSSESTAVELEYRGSTLWSGVNDATVRGSYAYAAFQSGLQILDISDSTNIRLVSQLYLAQGSFGSIAIQGDYAYLAAAGFGIVVVNVADPQNPFVESWCDTPGSASAIAVAGNFAYVADLWAGMQVVNVADPKSPSIVGTYDTPGEARDIVVSGEYAYIADGYIGGVQIVNVGLAELPYPASSFATDGTASGVALSGNLLIVADKEYGLVVLDVTDPTRPVKTDYYPHSIRRGVLDVAVSGAIAYLTSGERIDISNPDSLRVIDTLQTFRWRNRLTVSGNLLIGIRPDSGLTFCDISIPTAPRLAGRYASAPKVSDVVVRDSFAYAHEPYAGVNTVRIVDPRKPEVVDFYPLVKDGAGIALRDSYLYVTDADSGLRVLDISDPSTPAPIKVLPIFGSDVSIPPEARYGCVSNISTGMRFVDFVDRLNPVVIGVFPVGYGSVGWFDGARGYIAASAAGLRIINFVDSAAPFKEGTLGSLFGRATTIAVRQPYAYVGLSGSGFAVVDVQSPSNPTLVKLLGNAVEFNDMVLVDDFVFMAFGLDGISVVDVTDPSNPMWAGHIETPGEAMSLAVSGATLCVADKYSLVILEIKSPTAVKDRRGNSLPGNFHLAQNYPNPFNPSTTIEFGLPSASRVELVVFDLLGRQVKTLVNGMMASGMHRLNWDGTDSDGYAVAAGVYLYRMRASGISESRKMLLIR